MLAFQAERTKLFYNHSGIFSRETTTVFGGGLGLVKVPWASWPHFNHTFWIQNAPCTSEDAGGNAGPSEVSFMILDAWEYTRSTRYLERYLRIPVETMEFFMQARHVACPLDTG